MRVGIIGTGVQAQARERAVAALRGFAFQGVLGTASLGAYLERVDVVFVTASTAEHFRLAEAATKQGVHVFMEWPPATSVQECQAIIGLSEEAGVEWGGSGPGRAKWRAPILVRAPILLRRAPAGSNLVNG